MVDMIRHNNHYDNNFHDQDHYQKANRFSKTYSSDQFDHSENKDKKDKIKGSFQSCFS